MLITLKNDFHHTTTTIRVGSDLRLNRRQVRRSKAALCGVSGCHCSDGLGLRGVVDFDATSGLEFVENYDGSGQLVRVDRNLFCGLGVAS